MTSSLEWGILAFHWIESHNIIGCRASTIHFPRVFLDHHLLHYVDEILYSKRKSLQRAFTDEERIHLNLFLFFQRLTSRKKKKDLCYQRTFFSRDLCFQRTNFSLFIAALATYICNWLDFLSKKQRINGKQACVFPLSHYTIRYFPISEFRRGDRRGDHSSRKSRGRSHKSRRPVSHFNGSLDEILRTGPIWKSIGEKNLQTRGSPFTTRSFLSSPRHWFRRSAYLFILFISLSSWSETWWVGIFVNSIDRYMICCNHRPYR